MYDVFISYSTENQAQADHIKQHLEEAGLSCWYAPQSLRGAMNFTQEIPDAIASSKAFLLLMSKDAQESRWVARELGEADDHKNLPIFTFFLEEMTLNKNFRFMLRYSQHYPIQMGFDAQMTRLLEDLRKYVKRPLKDIIFRPIPKIERKNKKLPLILGAAAALVAVVAAVFLLLGGGKPDGEYVIWNPEYAIALSGDPIHTYYHAGEQVLGQGDNLVSYNAKCVWELDFDGDVFTMSRNGMTLGVEPGERGVGLGGDFIADRWELVEADDGLYYIRNIETGYYLEWYAQKNNWSTHDQINANNRGMFLVRIDPAK